MRAQDVLSPVSMTLAPHHTIRDVIRFMLEHHVSGVPIVDVQGQLLGLFTESDLLRRAEIGTATRRWGPLNLLIGSGALASEYAKTHTRSIQDIMTRNVHRVTATTEVSDLVGMMERFRVRHIPVVQDGVCVGIVSLSDIVRALGRALDVEPSEEMDDGMILARVQAEIHQATWCAGTRVTPSVQNGVVHLDGVVFDDRQRQALLVLVRNIPGVKGCIDRISWIDTNSGITYAPSPEVVRLLPMS